MAKPAPAEIRAQLERISRGPAGAMKRLKEVLNTFRQASTCRNKEIEPALMAAIETLEARHESVQGLDLGMLNAALSAGLCGLAKRRTTLL